MSAARAAVYAYKINGWDDEMSLADDRIKVTKDTAAALFPGQAAGYETSAATLLMLAGIWAKRAADSATSNGALIKIIANRDEVDEAVLGEQIAQAMAPAVGAVVTPVIEALLQEGGATHLTADQIREAAAMAVREVLLQGVAE
jgi:hypothetical protein